MLRVWYRLLGCRFRRKCFIVSTMSIAMLLIVYSIILGCIANVYSIVGADSGANLAPGPHGAGLQFLTHHNRNLKNSLTQVDSGLFQVPRRSFGTENDNNLDKLLADDKIKDEDGNDNNNIYMDGEYMSSNEYMSDNKNARQQNIPGSRLTSNKNNHNNSTKRLPQAIIIGVKKGGTRALLEFLRIHPNVRAPGPEPHFFDKHYKNGLSWYRDQMPDVKPGQMTIEKTPSYFVTKGIPEKVYKMSKKVKLIIVVRDPVTRAISDYAQLVERKPSLAPFEDMVFINNRTKIINTSWTIVKIGVYAQHLVRWMEYFPLRQMHFVSGENLIRDPASEILKVQQFLGLDPTVDEDYFSFNKTKGFPCYKKDLSNPRWHCLNNGKGRPHPNVNHSVVRRLREFYRPFNIKLYNMIGQDLGWS